VKTQHDKNETQYLRDSLETQGQKLKQSHGENRFTQKLETKSIPKSESLAMQETVPEPQQVIVVQLPPSEQGVDWKSLISWAIAALNGVGLLGMNIKNIGKNR